MVHLSAIVLCGGRSRRMGGTDKTALPLGDRTVLDHLLDALPARWRVVCVGVERPTRRDVSWTREQPPGGGPVAGIAAGLDALDALEALGAVDTDVVVVLAGDQPFAGPAAVELARVLLEDAAAAAPVDEATAPVDAATALDGEGRRQPLLTAYRTAALRRAVPEPAADTPARHLLGGLHVVEVPQPGQRTEDVDTPEALERARDRAGSRGTGPSASTA